MPTTQLWFFTVSDSGQKQNSVTCAADGTGICGKRRGLIRLASIPRRIVRACEMFSDYNLM